MQEIALHCKKCRKSLHVAYMPTGKKNVKVLQGATMTCGNCHNKYPRAMSLHNFTEEEFLQKVEGSKFFI